LALYERLGFRFAFHEHWLRLDISGELPDDGGGLPPGLHAVRYGPPQLGVVPAWRRRGVARALLVQALRGFRDAGFPHAALTVNDDNPAALGLYDRLGFNRMADRVMYRKDA